LASAIIDRYQTLDDLTKIDHLSWLCQSLAPDPQRLDAAARAYLHDPSETNIIKLSRAVEAPRQEFLRWLNQALNNHPFNSIANAVSLESMGYCEEVQPLNYSYLKH